ncbi:CRISPR-associated endonuclease Cas2 [Lyngbya confervoides]|uniref:CRISPR-associated endoribonuclease Cas2 n=1 Tax=Lyngbya confervoides BDU141951 TaxID=1574623 RepID=A0ABD4T4R8_9CYAN|nr:CRISPR-associated endonuclease Cas2 [Lyngbya confervoides]MCM1983649.1 CRISPR-associated endonuclease Cas2 [Lyngbya confervoides BDU141951]
MLLYVITDDVPDDRRPKRVSDLLEGYGQRVQYSVFECILSERKYAELQQRLQGRVKLKEDSIRFYPLSKHTLGRVDIWGGVELTQVQGSVVV